MAILKLIVSQAEKRSIERPMCYITKVYDATKTFGWKIGVRQGRMYVRTVIVLALKIEDTTNTKQFYTCHQKSG